MASSPSDDECTCDDNYTCPSCVAYKGKGDKGRGATRMAFIARARNRGVRFNVQFNERGQPIGDHSEKMMSYWGFIVKKFIPITFENWHKVPKTLKDTLFEDLTITFDVSMFRKKWFLTRAGEIWKNFKCELTRYWLFDEKKQLHDVPPSKYDFINTTHWRRFVKSRLTEEFQIAKKKANGEIVSKISRAELWKQMRSDEDENVSESTKEITDRIDDLIRRAHEGEFDDVGREDVLQRAFKKKKEPVGSDNEVSEKGNLDESCYDDVTLNETPYIPDIAALSGKKTPHIPEDVAVTGKKAPHIPQVHNTGEVAHTLSLPKGFMRVGIDYAIEKQTPLPVPNEDAEAFVIKEAIGALGKSSMTCRELLGEGEAVGDTPLDANDKDNPDSHSHTPSKRKDEELSLPQKRAKTNDSSHASSKLQPRTLDASHEIMVPHPETLPPDLQMLHKLWYRRCQTLGLVNMFGFLCPSGISPVAKFKKGDVNKAMEHRMDRSCYIASVFNRSATKGRIFLAPYNVGHHWILCVIDPYNSIVYFMDPLQNDKNKGTGNGVCEDLRTLIET
ncbi:Chromosome partition protein MukB [Bienertia sinuspersici]